MAKKSNQHSKSSTGADSDDQDFLESLVSGYGSEYSNLSKIMENVDAALESLESQSDELFDEVKLMLEEVRQDKAELKNVKAETDADDAGTSQKETNSQDKSQPNGLPSEQCNSVDPNLKQNAEVSSSPFNKDDKIS